ncbi:hypothetical protein [Rubrivirga sp. IMCC43871]|uniref:hypothetical protein n=1 Tax=Rubrivirga sp. IMCC43871 TaxID=3391575 RepID=UPI0039903047
MMVRAAALLLLAATLAACAPRLSPPYRDYEIRATEPDVTARLREAVAAAGWTLAESLDPAIVTTASRDVGAGLTSSTSAALDLVPLDGGFIRVYVRAERRSILGGRSKVYALDGPMRQRILGPLSEALAERGLVPLGTPRDRDEDATD